MQALLSWKNSLGICLLVAIIVTVVFGLLGKFDTSDSPYYLLISWSIVLLGIIFHVIFIPRKDYTWKRFFNLKNIAVLCLLVSFVFFAITAFMQIGCYAVHYMLFLVIGLILYLVYICIPWKSKN